MGALIAAHQLPCLQVSETRLAGLKPALPSLKGPKAAMEPCRPQAATCTGCRCCPHSAEGWHDSCSLKESVQNIDGLLVVPALQEDPELKPLFEKAQKGGMQAVMALMNDQQFLQKIGEKMGDVPEVAAPAGAGPAAAPPEVNNLLDAAK